MTACGGADAPDGATEETALLLLSFMALIGKAAIAGADIAKPYLDAGAVRIVNGEPEFHRDRFIELMAKQMVEQK